MASDLEVLTTALNTLETRIMQRIDEVETRLMTAGANNLENCVDTIEAVGESIRGMITAEGIRLKTQRLSDHARIAAVNKRVDALEARLK